MFPQSHDAPGDRPGPSPGGPSPRPWVAPETGAGGDPAPAGGQATVLPAPVGIHAWRGTGRLDPRAGGERGWSDRAPGREPPPLPARLAPLTLSDLLDGAWAVIACRPRTVLGLSALFIVPAEVLASFLVRGYGQALDTLLVAGALFPFVRRNEPGQLIGYGLGPFLAVAVLSFAYMLLGAAVGRLVAAWHDQADLRLGQVLRATLRALPALGAAWALVSVLQVLSIYLAVIPALFVFPLFLLVAPVITIERRGPLAAMRRSVQLVGRRLVPVMGIWLVSLLLERLIDAALAAAPELAAQLAPEPVAQILRPAGWAFALFVTAPTVTGLCVLLYFDLRVRTEGLDLDVEAAEVFGGPAPAVAGSPGAS